MTAVHDGQPYAAAIGQSDIYDILEDDSMDILEETTPLPIPPAPAFFPVEPSPVAPEPEIADIIASTPLSTEPPQREEASPSCFQPIEVLEPEPAPLPPAVAPQASVTQANAMSQRVVILKIETGSLGNSRKIGKDQFEVDAEKESVHAQKKLLDGEEFRAVNRIPERAKGWVEARSLPSFLMAGTYLLPIALIVEADEKLTAFKAEWQEALDLFVPAYPRLLEDAARRLRAVFNPADYPSPEMLRHIFRFEWRFIEISAPGSLRTANPELWRREQEKIANQWQEALEEARQVLRVELAGLVNHLAERLTPGEDGKPKRFEKGTVEKLHEWLSLFDVRNIADDGELKSLVERAKVLLSDRGAEDLKRNPVVRSVVRQGMQEIKQQLTGLIQTQTRAVRFEDE